MLRLKRSTLNFCTHISHRLQHKIMSTFFLTTSCWFFFLVLLLISWHCWILHEKSWNQIIQKIFEKKEIAGTILFVPWLATNQLKKLIENCNSAGARTHKVGKVWPTLTLIFSIFEEREKGKLYIYRKKFVLVHLKNFHIFINMSLFCLKGYSGTLIQPFITVFIMSASSRTSKYFTNQNWQSYLWPSWNNKLLKQRRYRFWYLKPPKKFELKDSKIFITRILD